MPPHTNIQAPADEAPADEYKVALLDALIVACILRPEHEHDARAALHDLISWHVAVALDPAVSSDAQALIDRGKHEAMQRAGS